MTALRRVLALLGAGCCLALGSGGAVASSHAPQTTGTPGYCPDSTGVTVVVDFKKLGGGIVVRCAPGPIGSDFTGLDALRDAGFTPQGVQRWGLAFVCRIAGKPAPDQDLPVKGDRHYQEACIDTPPPYAYWGYWYAPNGGSWTYSDRGAMDRDVTAGGFEGWAFSLNHTEDSAPRPGIAPRRPHRPPPTTPPPSSPPHTSPPHTSTQTRPPSSAPPSTASPPTHPSHFPTHESPTAPGGVTTSPPHTEASPTQTTAGAGSGGPGPPGDDPVAAGHNARGERVSGVLPDAAPQPGSSARNALLGIGLVVVLAAGGAIAARRRRAAH